MTILRPAITPSVCAGAWQTFFNGESPFFRPGESPAAIRFWKESDKTIRI
jgi:hypothetical protein